MKKLIVLFFSVLINANISLNAQSGEPFMKYSFAPLLTSTIKDVEATTTNGSITVTGVDATEAVVEMYVSRNNEFPRNRRRNNSAGDDIKDILEEDYTIDIKVEDGKLIAFARPKNNIGQQRLSISFKISVPKQVNSNLNTSNARVEISNLSGSHSFRTSNGRVEIENVSGVISGSTSNGRVSVTNSSEVIDIRTSNGSITVKDCNGNIVLRTSNGTMTLTNLSGNISATTSNGGITANNINGELRTSTSNGTVRFNGISGSVDASTSNSSMTVDMKTVSDFVKLTTSNGSVNLSLPADRGYDLNARGDRVETSGLKNFSGKMDNKNLNGKIADGGATIDVNTSGRANLMFR